MDSSPLPPFVWLIAVLVVAAIIALIVVPARSRNRRLQRGQLPGAELELQVERLLVRLYKSLAGDRRQPIRFRSDYFKEAGLTYDQGYFVIHSAVAGRRVSTRTSGDGLADLWNGMLARLPHALVLADREYDERSHAAGIRLAGGSITTASMLSPSQLHEITLTLDRDGAKEIAAALRESIEQNDRAGALETVSSVMGIVADGATIWQATAAVIASFVGAASFLESCLGRAPR